MNFLQRLLNDRSIYLQSLGIYYEESLSTRMQKCIFLAFLSQLDGKANYKFYFSSESSNHQIELLLGQMEAILL